MEASWHGLPKSCGVKPRGASASRVPASHGASWRRTGGGGSGGSDPHIFAAGTAPGRGRRCTPKSTTTPPRFGVAPSTVIPGGKASRRPFALMEDECLLRVALCSFVTCLSLHVLLCVFMLHRVPLHIPVSPEARQGLQRLGIQRHLNVGSRLRVLVDEAPEEQQTTDGPEAEKGKAGGCSQPDISDPNPGAAYHPARRSRTKSLGGCNIVRRNCSVKPWKNGRSSSSPQRSSHIASVSPLSHKRSSWTTPRTGQPRVPASRETPLHGWRTDHIVPTPRVSSPLSAPSPDGGGRGTLRRLLGRHRGQTRRRSSPRLDRTVTVRPVQQRPE